MWRLARVPMGGVQRRRLMASAAATTSALPSCCISSNQRSFSRQVRNLGEPDDYAIPADELTDPDKATMRSFSATDMEIYDELRDQDDSFFQQDDFDEEAHRKKQEEIQRELDSRKGRVWTDHWEITEKLWVSSLRIDDIPDWSPDHVSRISQERVKIHPDKIPTLSTVASMSFPNPPFPRPGLGQAKEYAKLRKRAQFEYISNQVKEAAKPKMDKIFALKTWQDKQDAVDELFESVEDELRAQEEILGLHPRFGDWVSRALEEYLRSVQKDDSSSPTVAKDGESSASAESTGSNSGSSVDPVFIDCFNPDDGDAMVPRILTPLMPHPKDGPGRMVEEWELAAHKKTKRILLREPSQKVAQILEANESCRIFVHGERGVGKSATLATIVASARKSGSVVLYLPDGDRLRKNGFYVTPNSKRPGIFDLQNFSQDACQQLLDIHGKDLEGMEAQEATIQKYFKETQSQKITDYSGGSMSLIDLLKYASQRKAHSPMCYVVAVETLMNQTEKPFLMVMDEFNCYYDRGHYFHMEYDEDVREPIPYEQISFFEHALRAAGLSSSDDEEAVVAPQLMKKGAIIVGLSESHAVPRSVTDGLISYASKQSTGESPVHVVEVLRFSDVEADHVLANFEATGIGKLRSDHGDTIMDDQEVAYLKTLSGNVGQRLIDVAIV